MQERSLLHNAYAARLAEAELMPSVGSVGPIGHIPPAKAEANYYAAINNRDMVALLK